MFLFVKECLCEESDWSQLHVNKYVTENGYLLAAATATEYLLRICRSKSTIVSIHLIFLWCLFLIPDILVQSFISLLDSTPIFTELGRISLFWYRIYLNFPDLVGFSDFFLIYLCSTLDFWQSVRYTLGQCYEQGKENYCRQKLLTLIECQCCWMIETFIHQIQINYCVLNLMVQNMCDSAINHFRIILQARFLFSFKYFWICLN